MLAMELKAEAEGWVQKTIEQDLSVLKTQRQRQVTRALCLVNKEYKRERLSILCVGVIQQRAGGQIKRDTDWV